MKKNLVRAAAVLALSLPVSTLQAQALELKVADSFPAGHYLVRLMLKPCKLQTQHASRRQPLTLSPTAEIIRRRISLVCIIRRCALQQAGT